MQHPLEIVPSPHRKRFFFTFLFLTLALFTVFRVLDQPLRTSAAPNGIVSFELAGTVQQADAITDSWKQTSLLPSAVTDRPNLNNVNIPYTFAAFSLGIDYFFMPLYSFALAFGTLLAAGRHSGWMKSLGAAAGWGAFAAAFFDAVENYALFQILLGANQSCHPAVAAVCASIKFGLLFFGSVYAAAGGLMPRKSL